MVSFMLTEKEKRTICRYCVYPHRATVALVMAMALAIPFLLGYMIGDLVFYGQGDLRFLGLGVYLGFFVVLMVIFIYCALVSKIGMHGKRWRALVDRAQVLQENEDYTAEVGGIVATSVAAHALRSSDNDAAVAAGNVATVANSVATAATTAIVMNQLSHNAEDVARAYGIEVPNDKPIIVALIIVPLLALTAAFGASYVSASDAIGQSQAAATSQAERLADAFTAAELGCEAVPDPADGFHEYGYSIYGFAGDTNYYDAEQEIRVKLDKDGLATDVYYSAYIDKSQSAEENLRQAEEDFHTFHKALVVAGIEMETDGIASSPEFLDTFCEQYLAGESEISESEIIDDHEVFCHFDGSETKPEIRLHIEAR